MWTEDELGLEKAIKICRAAERTSKEINELHLSELEIRQTLNVSAVAHNMETETVQLIRKHATSVVEKAICENV